MVLPGVRVPHHDPDDALVLERGRREVALLMVVDALCQLLGQLAPLLLDLQLEADDPEDAFAEQLEVLAVGHLLLEVVGESIAVADALSECLEPVELEEEEQAEGVVAVVKTHLPVLVVDGVVHVGVLVLEERELQIRTHSLDETFLFGNVEHRATGAHEQRLGEIHHD